MKNTKYEQKKTMLMATQNELKIAMLELTAIEETLKFLEEKGLRKVVDITNKTYKDTVVYTSVIENYKQLKSDINVIQKEISELQKELKAEERKIEAVKKPTPKYDKNEIEYIEYNTVKLIELLTKALEDLRDIK
jgi:hypothetical protein